MLAARLPQAMHGFERDTIPPLENEGAVYHAELWDATGKYTWPDGVSLIGIGVGRYKRTDITTKEKGDTTVISIICEHPEDIELYENIIQEIGHVAMRAREFKRDNQKITGEMAIERYYRRKARGSKVTLREIAETYGFNESYLSQAKKKYDQEGKWGSKSKKSDDKT